MLGPQASMYARRIVLGGVLLFTVALPGCSTGRNRVTGFMTTPVPE
jgi:hypothetical protein